MADTQKKTIGQLQAASSVTDDTLLPIEQSGSALSMTAQLLKAYILSETATTAETLAYLGIGD